MSTYPNRSNRRLEPDRFAGRTVRLPSRGDEAELYCRYCDRLREFLSVQGIPGHGPFPAAVIREASWLAWTGLVRYQPSRHAVFDWLCAVALAEARRIYELGSEGQNQAER